MSSSATNGRRQARLVVMQGPGQGVTATAAVQARERERPGLANVLMVGGLFADHASTLRDVTVECARAVAWDEVVDGVYESAPTDPLRALRQRWQVDELLLVRNWQPLNE